MTGRGGFERTLIVGGIVGLLAIGGFYAVQRIGIFRIGGAIMSSVLKSPQWQKMASDGRAVDQTIARLYGRRGAVLVSAVCLLGTWTAGAVEMWIAMRALGIPAGFAKAYVIEAASQAIRSGFFILPGALGAQESGFLLMGRLLGISDQMSMALALIRRVREVAFGLSGVIMWQWVEWRKLRKSRLDEMGPSVVAEVRGKAVFDAPVN